MKTLRDYQVESQVILGRDTSGIDGSDMGTGKTLSGVERVREISRQIGHIPRVLVIAPANTQRQWLALFAEQFPHLGQSDHLRIVGTPRSDPESWNNYLLKKKTGGVFIIGWEAMRGSAPKTVKAVGLVDKVTRKPVEDIPLVLAWWNDPSSPIPSQYRRVNRAVNKEIPAYLQKPNRQGATRGYGDLYKNGSSLTKQAAKAAARAGDVPPWHRTGTWDLVIVDESHRMANPHSINKMTLTLINALNKLAMSATFAGNKPEGAWSTLNWLWPKLYSSRTKWVSDFFITEDEYVGSNRPVKKIVGEIDPGAIWQDIPCKVRHRIEEVRGQLPDVIERIVEVSMLAEQRRIYDDFADESLAWIDDHPVGAPLPISQRIRLRQAALGKLKISHSVREVDEWMDRAELEDELRPFDAPYVVVEDREGDEQVLVRISEEVEEVDFDEKVGQPKIDIIKDILTDLPEDEPVMIYTHSSRWAHMAAGMLSEFGSVLAWTGALKARERDEAKATFGTPDGPRIIIAQLQAIAEGVDGLQHRCCHEIWASPTDAEATINSQAKGRLHRDGQKRIVQRWLLHSTDTIDTGLDQSLRRRREQMRQFYRDDVA